MRLLIDLPPLRKTSRKTLKENMRITEQLLGGLVLREKSPPTTGKSDTEQPQPPKKCPQSVS